MKKIYRVTYQGEYPRLSGEFRITTLLYKQTEDLKVALKAIEECDKENGNVALETVLEK